MLGKLGSTNRLVVEVLVLALVLLVSVVEAVPLEVDVVDPVTVDVISV